MNSNVYPMGGNPYVIQAMRTTPTSRASDYKQGSNFHPTVPNHPCQTDNTNSFASGFNPKITQSLDHQPSSGHDDRQYREPVFDVNRSIQASSLPKDRQASVRNEEEERDEEFSVISDTPSDMVSDDGHEATDAPDSQSGQTKNASDRTPAQEIAANVKALLESPEWETRHRLAVADTSLRSLGYCLTDKTAKEAELSRMNRLITERDDWKRKFEEKSVLSANQESSFHALFKVFEKTQRELELQREINSRRELISQIERDMMNLQSEFGRESAGKQSQASWRSKVYAAGHKVLKEDDQVLTTNPRTKMLADLLTAQSTMNRGGHFRPMGAAH